MKTKISVMALALLLSAGMGAQTIYDAAALTDKDLNGTARFVGMGGAMGALGGDISVINSNPAGIGIYRSNDAMLSFGFSSYGTESDYLGNTMDTRKVKGSFDNLGFVISSKIGNETTLRYVNFGFGYRRAKSFYRNMKMGGNLGDYSQTFQMAAQAGGLTAWGGNPFNDENIGWLSAMGYEGKLITDLMSQTELDQTPGYDNWEPYLDSNGKPVHNLDGDVMYRTPGDYVGMYPDGTATFRSQERGGIDQYDFNISFNLKDRVYLGVTVGAYTVDYSKYTFYDEDYGYDEGYNLQSWNSIKGSGFDFKFGAIVRPFQYSPLRVGLSVHTPVFYRLDYRTNARLESDVLNPLAITDSGTAPGEIGHYDIDTYDLMNGDMIRRFQLRTPWTYNLSVGYTVGTSLALGAEYEYRDYSCMKFRDGEGYSDAFAPENRTTGMMKGVSTLRVGAEYNVVPGFAVRAGYNYSSSIFRDDAYKSLPLNSIQTDTDFSNSESMHRLTLGMGYRGAMFYADLAYQYNLSHASFYPFDMFDGERLVQATELKNTRHQLLFTLGARF